MGGECNSPRICSMVHLVFCCLLIGTFGIYCHAHIHVLSFIFILLYVGSILCHSPFLQPCVIHVAMIVVMNVSVVPGHCTGCCRYRHWYLFLLSRKQELQNYGIFQKHGASGKSLLVSSTSVFRRLPLPRAHQAGQATSCSAL